MGCGAQAEIERLIKGKKVLAIIPARGGSKRVPRKNLRTLAGKPLIAWTIEEAKKSHYIDRLVLSSEDGDIISESMRLGLDVPFTRPTHLAGDENPGWGVLLHAMSELPGFDFIVELQPTSPFRLACDIDASIELCEGSSSLACVSVTELDKTPAWTFWVDKDGSMKSLLPMDDVLKNQDELPCAYTLNGAVFVARTSWVRTEPHFAADQMIAYKMPRERSIDIDTEIDFLMAELLARRVAERAQEMDHKVAISKSQAD